MGEYLIKCVCSENLLYVSETLQYMRDLQEQYGVKPSTVQSQNYLDSYAIPDKLPLSNIMTKFESTAARFLKICEKYILEQSEFEINISHKNRKNLTLLFKKLESKVDEYNPSIKKLKNWFGDDSNRSVSRRASQATLMDKSNGKLDNEGPVTMTTPSADSHHDLDATTVSASRLSHQCITDRLMLSQKDVQNIYDCLCATLGDVYSNLNDAGMRFMQTDVYFRWYDHNITDKEQSDGKEILFVTAVGAKLKAIRRNTENSVSKGSNDSPSAKNESKKSTIEKPDKPVKVNSVSIEAE